MISLSPLLLRVRGHCDIIQMLQRNPFCLKERRFIIRENKGDVKIYEIRDRRITECRKKYII